MSSRTAGGSADAGHEGAEPPADAPDATVGAHRLRRALAMSISGAERAGQAGPATRPGWLGTLRASGKLTGLQALAQVRGRIGAPAADGGPVTTTVHGLRITAPSWWDLSYLYGEVFVGQAYHFEADTDRPFIVDAGGNIGMATLYFKHLYPKARVLAFEPNPAIADLFEENVRANGLQDVQLERVAICDRDHGTIDFHVDPDLAGGLTSSTDAGRVGGQLLQVPAKRLSGYLDAPVELLKLDVEGAEHAVLDDLIESDAIASIRRLAIEYHHHISPGDDRLGGFLSRLEAAGCGYQLNSRTTPTGAGIYQDIAIDAYNRAAFPGVAAS